jgi:hypothetical protein
MLRLGTLDPSLKLTAIAAAALILTACQVPQSGMHATAKPAGQPAVSQNPGPSQGQETAAQTFQSLNAAPKPAMLAATPAVAHDAAPISLHLSGDPKELVGLDHAVVRRALGEPLHIRNEMPAQVWQYATGDCVVDLYLYNQDGAWTVTYVEARSHTAESAPTARCLRSLLERPTASAG